MKRSDAIVAEAFYAAEDLGSSSVSGSVATGHLVLYVVTAEGRSEHLLGPYRIRSARSARAFIARQRLVRIVRWWVEDLARATDEPVAEWTDPDYDWQHAERLYA